MTATPARPDRRQLDEFTPTEELVRRQGVRPIASIDKLAAPEDPFSSDKEHEEFLADPIHLPVRRQLMSLVAPAGGERETTVGSVPPAQTGPRMRKAMLLSTHVCAHFA